MFGRILKGTRQLGTKKGSVIATYRKRGLSVRSSDSRRTLDVNKAIQLEIRVAHDCEKEGTFRKSGEAFSENCHKRSGIMHVMFENKNRQDTRIGRTGVMHSVQYKRDKTAGGGAWALQ
jgi:hypothetical protein